jgi:hypothetical protein
MANQLGTLSPEDYAQQQQINRQQKMAEMLMSQTQQPQGQMVSGHYVAPSFFQNIAPLVNMYQGQRLAEKADTDAAKLAEAIRGKQQQQVEGYLNALNPTQNALQGPTEDGSQLMTQNKPNLAEAFRYATNPYAPASLQTAGYEMLKPQKLGQGESIVSPNLSTGTYSPIATNPKEIKNPAEIDLALSLDRSLPRDTSKWTQEDADRANKVIINHIREKRPVNINTTNVMGGETEYNKTFGKELATQDMSLIQTARNAPQILANNKRQLDLLNKGDVITGVGANQRLDLARFGQAIGLNNDPNVVANTQQLLAGRAGSVLDSIKASGLGAGNGFSNADRDFLEKAKLGGISYDKNALKRQLEIESNVTKALVNQYNQRIKDMPVAGKLKLQPVEVGGVEYLGPVK